MSIVKLNNKAVSNATAFGSISSLGSMVFIKKLTASSSATLSFVDGTDGVVLDDTYKEYLFTFKNIHPATDDTNFQMNFSVDGGTNYNVAKTTTYFRSIHNESDATALLGYETANDLAQGTGFKTLCDDIGADADQNANGTFNLFNPSSTTFVKHFTCRIAVSQSADYAMDLYTAGYGNTTSAIDAVRFQMSSGNIDAGDICLYGIA
jgi:hypothetical protein